MSKKLMGKKLLALFVMVMLTLTTVKPVLAADGDSIDTAISIEIGKTIKGSFPNEKTIHYYRFTIPKSGEVIVKGSFDVYRLEYCMYDEYGSRLRSKEEYNKSISDSFSLTKGTYYFSVATTNSSKYSGTYRFSLQFKDAHESFPENYGGSNNSKFDANTISLNKSYNGQIGWGDKEDWYKFTVSASGKYKFSFLALNRKNVYLYNEANEQLKHSDNSDYTETWELTKGTYYLKMTADSYSYYSSYSFQISKPEAPKATSISKLQSLSKGFKINVKKVSATGYQVQYSTNSKFTKASTKTFYKTSLSVKNLIAKKTYYVRVRSYNVFDGKKYCSKWSVAKKIKTKK